jgi:hypothetical protein
MGVEEDLHSISIIITTMVVVVEVVLFKIITTMAVSKLNSFNVYRNS